MKHHYNLIKFLAILVAFWGFCHIASGQSVINLNSPFATSKSLVADYNGMGLLSVSDEGISYNEYGSTLVYSYRFILPLTVNDISIMGDSLYFCGEMSSSGYFGYVNIPNIITGAPPFGEIVQCPPLTSSNVQINRFKKIEAFIYNSNKSVIMIGEDNTTSGLTSVVAAHLSSSGSWDFMMKYDYSNLEIFTDVISTSSFVATVARKNQSSATIMRRFNISPSPAYSNILEDPEGGYRYQIYQFPVTWQPQVLTKTRGNEVAIASITYNYPDYALSIATADIANFTPPIGLPSAQCYEIGLPLYNLGSEVLDIAYSAPTDNMYVTAKIDNGGGLQSYLFEVPYMLTGTPVLAYEFPADTMFSVTCNPAFPAPFNASVSRTGSRIYNHSASSSPLCPTPDSFIINLLTVPVAQSLAKLPGQTFSASVSPAPISIMPPSIITIDCP